MATTTEAERKYEVPGDFTLPDLSRLPAVAEVGQPAEHRLDATYYDTPGLCLAAAHVTLRRRAGGHDDGWHVKRPAGDGDRTESRVPLTDPAGGVPDEVAAQVRDLAGSTCRPSGTPRTSRLAAPRSRPSWVPFTARKPTGAFSSPPAGSRPRRATTPSGYRHALS
jgi:CYTH domain